MDHYDSSRSFLLRPEHIFRPFIVNFHALIFKNQPAAAHSAITKWQLQISSSDQCSLADKSSRQKLLFQSQKIWKMAAIIIFEFFIWRVTYILKNKLYIWSTNTGEWSAIVTHYSQSNCQMRYRQTMYFSNLNMKTASKRKKYMIQQPHILQN